MKGTPVGHNHQWGTEASQENPQWETEASRKRKNPWDTENHYPPCGHIGSRALYGMRVVPIHHRCRTCVCGYCGPMKKARYYYHFTKILRDKKMYVVRFPTDKENKTWDAIRQNISKKKGRHLHINLCHIVDNEPEWLCEEIVLTDVPTKGAVPLTEDLGKFLDTHLPDRSPGRAMSCSPVWTPPEEDTKTDKSFPNILRFWVDKRIAEEQGLEITGVAEITLKELEQWVAYRDEIQRFTGNVWHRLEDERESKGEKKRKYTPYEMDNMAREIYKDKDKDRRKKNEKNRQ